MVTQTSPKINKEIIKMKSMAQNKPKPKAQEQPKYKNKY